MGSKCSVITKSVRKRERRSSHPLPPTRDRNNMSETNALSRLRKYSRRRRMLTKNNVRGRGLGRHSPLPQKEERNGARI